MKKTGKLKVLGSAVVMMGCIFIVYIMSLSVDSAESVAHGEDSLPHLNDDSIVAQRENNPDDIRVVVNKTSKLPDGYRPTDLVVPNVSFSFNGIVEKSYVREEAARGLEKLFALAKQDGIQLNAVSGFRSYEYQKNLYERNVRKKGKEHVARFSAKPGHSEHQTGLVMDVSANSVNNALEQYFADTKEGKWLHDNAHRAGFIIRYPKGKEHITGYAYEPWHLRYVGNIAEEICKQQVTLEEYMGQ